MTGHGFGIMSRVRPARSHQNLRTTWAPEHPAEQKTRQRNHSVSHTSTTATVPSSGTTSSTTQPSRKISDAGHWPPLEFDPLKLNPTTVVVAAVVPAAAAAVVQTTGKAPPRLYERGLLRTRSLRATSTKKPSSSRQSASPAPAAAAATPFEPRTRPRLHHSDSGISFDYDAYRKEKQQFNFAEEKAKALQQQQPQPVVDNRKGWPSPASSVDSGKSWFDLDDDSEDDDDMSSVTSESEVEHDEDKEQQPWAEPPSPRRRPQVGSPDDPTNYLKRGAWKRRGIFFGQQTNEVYEKEDDAFDL